MATTPTSSLGLGSDMVVLYVLLFLMAVFLPLGALQSLTLVRQGIGKLGWIIRTMFAGPVALVFAVVVAPQHWFPDSAVPHPENLKVIWPASWAMSAWFPSVAMAAVVGGFLCAGVQGLGNWRQLPGRWMLRSWMGWSVAFFILRVWGDFLTVHSDPSQRLLGGVAAGLVYGAVTWSLIRDSTTQPA